VIGFGLCGRTYGVYQLRERDPWLERMQARIGLGHGVLLGGAFALAGFGLEGIIVARWLAQGLGSLSEERLSVLAATLVIAGLQIFFTSFLLSIIGLRRRDE
jgi:hypothetical protein